MFVSVMTNNCSLEHWRSNSRVDHVISDRGPGGGRVELSTNLREVPVPDVDKTKEYEMNFAVHLRKVVSYSFS